MGETKLCRDCRFCVSQLASGGFEAATCEHPRAVRGSINLVTGERALPYASVQRNHTYPCGPDGLLFEPRPPAAPATSAPCKRLHFWSVLCWLVIAVVIAFGVVSIVDMLPKPRASHAPASDSAPAPEVAPK